MGIIDRLQSNIEGFVLKQRLFKINALADFALDQPNNFFKHIIYQFDRLRRKILYALIGQKINKFLTTNERIIAGGPFRGMKYISNAIGSEFLPKLVGSYECELNPFFSEVLATRYNVVIDIGCAEGYYAVGLALRIPQAHVFAFDTDDNAQHLCKDLARLNDVQTRVTIGGFCSSSTLDNTISGRTLVICDCEGYELELMDPIKSPSLKQVDMIIELHDFIDPAISSTIVSRFQDTHSLTLVGSVKDRSTSDFPILSVLSKNLQKIAIDENRPGVMQWACMVANTRTS